MSQSFAVGRAAAHPAAGEPHASVAALDPRRKLQLALAVLWLLDGILQYQPSMFTRAFPQMLGSTAHGNPALVAAPITWSAGFIGHHLAVANGLFATTQVALGLGIAWRPAVRLALAASVGWAAAVWWLGEGLGGVLAGTASPVGGAPGAVILYAVLAVLLWPADRDGPFVAARAVGRGPALAAWLAVWGSIAVFALLPASRAPQGLSGMISGMASGEPNWLAWLDTRLAVALTHQGLLASAVLAAVFTIVAAGVFLPARLGRAVLVLAVVVAVALWLAQGLGGIFTGAGTDPSSAPLLALLALSYWPRSLA